MWCDQQGFVIDDGTLFRFSDSDFRLCSQEKHLPWLIDTSHGFDVEIIDESKGICGISLQGPTSAAILRLLDVNGIDYLKPFHITQQIISKANSKNIQIANAKILLLGLTFILSSFKKALMSVPKISFFFVSI